MSISVASPLITPTLGKDALPPPPPSPGQKSGSGFWSSIPGSPASRPGSFTFPGETGETAVRQNSNQIHTGSGSHRHSTHSKEADRMSTCSSASEQSIHSTQSNGVRPTTCCPELHQLTQRQRGRPFLSFLPIVCCPAAASATNLLPTTHL